MSDELRGAAGLGAWESMGAHPGRDARHHVGPVA